MYLGDAHVLGLDAEGEETDQPFLTDPIEELLDISVQYEVHLSLFDPDRECVQRIVLAASGSETIREPEEVFIVDRVQHRDRRSLDNFILKGGDGERALASVRLWYVLPPCGACPVCTSLKPIAQILDQVIKVRFVGSPCQPVNAGGCITP